MNSILNSLKQEGLLDDENCNHILEEDRKRLFSIFWHLKLWLYLGVTCLAGGFGVLIYKNIDTIGHVSIVVLIGLISASCFFYCYKKSVPFSSAKVESSGIGYDYILLLGCLMFITFLGYLQWQYLIFGERYGLATFIPAVILLFIAYRFDHLGVLTMGLVLFASWLGLSVTPLDILKGNNFSSDLLIYTGVSLALLFGVCGYYHNRQNFKSHFTFTYFNFAAHLAGISCVSGLFETGDWYIWFPLLSGAVFAMHRYAIREKSFYFLLIALIYGYIGFAYVAFKFFAIFPDVFSIYLGFGCFIASSVLLIRYLKENKKSFSKHDDL